MPYKDPKKKAERHKEYMRERYRTDVDFKNQHHKNVKSHKNSIKEWFLSYKSNLKCETCEENHPACIDFHHRDRSQKEKGLGTIWIHGWSKEKIMEEVQKCNVLCSNCHRKFHWNERKRLC